MKDVGDWYVETFKKILDEELEKSREETQRIKEAQESIKHPHFYYAVYDCETGEVTYKRKKFWQWFSGKRVVRIKVAKIKTHLWDGTEDE